MKYYLIVLLTLHVFSKNMDAQNIYIGYGTSVLSTTQSVKMINSKDDFSYSEPQYIIGYRHNRKSINYFCQISNYNASTKIRLSKIAKVGFTGCNVTRLDVGIQKSIFKWAFIKNISPFLAVGVQKSKKFADVYGEVFKINGPDYFQTKDNTSTGKNLLQIIPSIGLEIGFKTIKRCNLSIVLQGVYGFKTFQSLNFDYRHKDSYQTERLAVFDTRGTGLFPSINLSYLIF